MRQVLLFLVGVVSLVGVVHANKSIDMDMMQTIEDINKSLSSNIALQDIKGSKADAQELQSLFVQVEKHFVEQGDAPDAVKLSTKSKTLAEDIIQAVDKKKFDEASQASTDLSRACRSCHNFYKKS